jgi:hypothetical protein
VGNIVSASTAAAAINIFTEPTGKKDKHFNKRFADEVDALIKKEQASGFTIYQIGNPLTKATYADFIEADQVNLIPIAVVVLLVILLLAFRMLQGVVVPLVTGLLSVVWGLGLMALFGIPVNTLTAIIPALLIAIGFTEDVHMIAEYHHHLRLGHPKIDAIKATMSEAAMPILVTTATTVLGFATLIFTDITMLIQFGWASSLGLTANFIITMVVLPVMLKWWPVPRRFRSLAFEDESTHGWIPRAMEWLAGFNIKYRVVIVVVTALVTIGSLVGWSSLRVNTDFISFFPQNSFIRQRTQDLHDSLAGGVTFYIVVETGRENGAKDPDLLNRIVGLQEMLAKSGRIDKTISVADYVRTMNREMHGGEAKADRIPETDDEVAQYLLTLEGRELSKYIDFNASTANIVVRHNITSSWELSALLKQIDAYVARNFPKNTVRYTGETILINNAADYMAVNEITSFASTFIIIGLIHAALFFSLWAGFLSLIPNVIPILTNFGMMGLLGIPLNTGTALVATIAIGIAVDDTVHHMVTYSRQLNKHHDQRIAMVNTMKSQGRPIIYVSLALAGGFLVLAFSNFVPTFYFGVLSAAVMLIAMVGELVLTPLLMYSTRLVTLWDMVLLKMDPELVKRAPLFRDFSEWEMRKVILLGALRTYRQGEYIVRKGDTGSEMYMVVSGRLRVTDAGHDGEEHALAEFKSGMVFGEVAALSGGVRSANVVAATDSDLLRLDWPLLERVRLRFPYTGAKLFRNVARILADRLSGGRPPLPGIPPQAAGVLTSAAE